MAMVLARASMQFSTNSAMALSGLLCERAMIRIAFQSSPIRKLPLSDSFDLEFIFAMVTRNSIGCVQQSNNQSQPRSELTIPTALNAGRGARSDSFSHLVNRS